MRVCVCVCVCVCVLLRFCGMLIHSVCDYVLNSCSIGAYAQMYTHTCSQPLHVYVQCTCLYMVWYCCAQDMLSVIAYGTSSVRQRALNLILYYWPLPNPEFTHHPSTMFVGTLLVM